VGTRLGKAKVAARVGCAARWVTVGEGIASPVSASKPCLKVSLHTAPQRYAHCHWHPCGLVICTLAPPPRGSSIHRSMACSRPLQRYSSRSPAYHRPHVGISASFPRGIGFLGNPSHMPYTVDTSSSRRTTQGYSVPNLRLSLKVGLHSSPGFSGVYPGRLQNRPALILAFWPKPIIRVGLSHVTTIQTWIRLPVLVQLCSTGFPVGF
jgi:hypothetical protein